MACNTNDQLSLDDVLAIKYPEAHRWSADGRYVSFLWEDGGKRGLWLASARTGELRCIASREEEVTEYEWAPDGRSLLYVSKGDIWHAEVDAPRKIRLTTTAGKNQRPAWSPRGDSFAFLMDKGVWLYAYPGHNLQHLLTLDKDARILEGKTFFWSHGGGKLGIVFGQNALVKLTIVDPQDGEVVWSSGDRDHAIQPIWFSHGDRLIYKKMSPDNTACAYVLLDLDAHKETALLEERDEKGLLLATPSEALSPDDNYLALILSRDGWDHVWVLNLETGRLTQLREGQFEDRGHVTDIPTWAPDGSKIAFSSSEGNLLERQLCMLTPDGEGCEKLTDVPGTSAFPKSSPDGKTICFVHSGPYKTPDLWLVDVDGDHSAVQLTDSMPENLTEENIVVPEPIRFESAGGWQIHGNLFKPRGFSPTITYPAVIFLHGGSVRQMRCGWHPTRGYSIFYSFNQYLAQKGYIVLSLNYRSGIGYGKAYQQGNYLSIGGDDCLDVVYAAEFLKSQSFVDPERVGLYGISYGGFLTLQALGKYPDVFRVGVNIAGVANWLKLVQWYETVFPGSAGFFKTRVAGGTEIIEEKYRDASPINFVQHVAAPLYNFHGTADVNVPFAQLDELVVELVKRGKDFEVAYYPDEVHLFEKRETWKDAFKRIEECFNRYLR